MRDFGEVWEAGPEDVGAAASALGEAAFDEAVSVWVTPDAARRRRRVTEAHEHAAAWLDSVRRTHVLLLAADGAGGVAGLAVWEFTEPAAGAGAGTEGEVERAAEADPPAHADLPAAASLEAVYGPDLPRLLLVHELAAARRVSGTPHWLLSQTAVLPELRGRGLGGALLRHHLTRVDEARLPAALEASTPRNQALYARHGFAPLGGPIALPDNGPHLQPMWRQGRSTSPVEGVTSGT